MRFLIDAQLPRRMTAWLEAAGHDAIHTLDLSEGNRTPDRAIIEVADREARVVVTKDADFVDSHLLSGCPAQLLLISTGNVRNHELEAIVRQFVPYVTQAFGSYSFLELNQAGLIVRG